MNTSPMLDSSLHLTRRHFFGKSALGVGTAAMTGLLNSDLMGAPTGFSGGLHHKAKAKRVIYLFMSGGLVILICGIINQSLVKNLGKTFRLK